MGGQSDLAAPKRRYRPGRAVRPSLWPRPWDVRREGDPDRAKGEGYPARRDGDELAAAFNWGVGRSALQGSARRGGRGGDTSRLGRFEDGPGLLRWALRRIDLRRGRTVQASVGPGPGRRFRQREGGLPDER